MISLTYSNLCLIYSSIAVMLIRIYAMYGASKRVIFILLPFFAANIFTAGTLIGKVLLNHGTVLFVVMFSFTLLPGASKPRTFNSVDP